MDAVPAKYQADRDKRVRRGRRGAIGRVGQSLGRYRLAVDQAEADDGVVDGHAHCIGEHVVGDQPGVAIDRDVVA